jgi:hypothetical protein
MDYVLVDELVPDQIMVGDLIEFEDEDAAEICEVTNIEELFIDGRYHYEVIGRNEFHEQFEMLITEWQRIKLFIRK